MLLYREWKALYLLKMDLFLREYYPSWCKLVCALSSWIPSPCPHPQPSIYLLPRLPPAVVNKEWLYSKITHCGSCINFYTLNHDLFVVIVWGFIFWIVRAKLFYFGTLQNHAPFFMETGVKLKEVLLSWLPGYKGYWGVHTRLTPSPPALQPWPTALL